MPPEDVEMSVLDSMIGGGGTPGAPSAAMANSVVCQNCAAAIDPATGEVIVPPPDPATLGLAGAGGPPMGGAPPPPLV